MHEVDTSLDIEPRNWLVAQIRPNCHVMAARNLSRQGVTVFAPFQQHGVRRGPRFTLVKQPLFPGYLFVSLNRNVSPWHAINATRGVSRLVSSSAGQPGSLPRPFIDGLIARCDAQGRLLPPPMFQRGEEVRILSGPFASLTATVEHMAPQQRVWVLLDILGGQKRVAAHAADLSSRPPSAPIRRSN